MACGAEATTTARQPRKPRPFCLLAYYLGAPTSASAHLLAAIDQQAQAVLAQTAVDAKITADALHTQASMPIRTALPGYLLGAQPRPNRGTDYFQATVASEGVATGRTPAATSALRPRTGRAPIASAILIRPETMEF